MAHHDPARVVLVLPPPETREGPPAARPPAVAPLAAAPPVAAALGPQRPAYPLGMRMDWDGALVVYSEAVGPDGIPRHTNHLETNVAAVADPRAMIAGLLQ